MLMIFLVYFFRCLCCKPCAKFKDRKIDEVIENPVSEQTETPNGFDTDRKPFVIEDKQALEKKLAALALISKRITALEQQRFAALKLLALKKCLRFVIREQERLAVLARKRNEALKIEIAEAVER